MPWFKVECGWWLTDWIIPLSSESQLCWLRLIEYTKEKGNRGSVKVISPAVAARIWMVGEESIRKMLEAAQMSGALEIVEGSWNITKWDQFQSDPSAKDRQAKARAKSSSVEPDVTVSYGASRDVTVTNCDNRESRLEERRGEESRRDEKRAEEKPPLAPQGETSGASRTWSTVKRELLEALPVPYHAIASEWCQYKSERKDKVWTQTGLRNWLAQFAGWDVQRLTAAIRHTMAQNWQGIKEPERSRQSPTPSMVLTAEQAGAINRGEGLIDRGSPIMRRQPE